MNIKGQTMFKLMLTPKQKDLVSSLIGERLLRLEEAGVDKYTREDVELLKQLGKRI